MGSAGSRSSASLGYQPELQGPMAHRPRFFFFFEGPAQRARACRDAQPEKRMSTNHIIRVQQEKKFPVSISMRSMFVRKPKN